MPPRFCRYHAPSQGQGFTLLEAIITVGVLLVLASIGIPRYYDYIGNFRAVNSSFSARAATATANAYSALSSAR